MRVSNELKSTEYFDRESVLMVESSESILSGCPNHFVRLTILKKPLEEDGEGRIETIEVDGDELIRAIENAVNR